MIDAFDSLWEQSRPAFEQERTWRRARTLALSTLVGLGRHTITGLLTTSAQQGVDWSAAYRLFEQERFDAGALFAPARRSVCSRIHAAPRRKPASPAMGERNGREFNTLRENNRGQDERYYNRRRLALRGLLCVQIAKDEKAGGCRPSLLLNQ